MPNPENLGETSPPGEQDTETQAREREFKLIREALLGLRFGVVSITVHDGAVVQIDRTEKRRIVDSRLR